MDAEVPLPLRTAALPALGFKKTHITQWGKNHRTGFRELNETGGKNSFKNYQMAGY